MAKEPALRAAGRCGVATLELVMFMPIILVLMIGIVWLGFSVVGQADVAVEARHNAWQRRFEVGSGSALNFLDTEMIQENATTKIDVSPLLDDVSPPESSHDVVIGTWDHNKIDMNGAPNWDLYLAASLNAKTGGLQNAYQDVRGMLGQLQGNARQIILDEVTNLIREALDNPLSSFTGGSDAAKAENDKQANTEKRQIEADIAATENELDRVASQIEDLRDKKAEAEDSDTKKSLESRLSVSRNKQKRLRAKLKRLKSDRRSMD